MESKKISFGFMKTKKSDRPIVQEKKEYIDCLEEKSIKVVGGEEIIENAPLVIPMKQNTLMTTERLKQIAEEVEGAVKEEPTDQPSGIVEGIKKPENLSLDQLAERELLEDAKKVIKVEAPILTVPLPNISITGEKESTLDDYESVPITEFGLAMLRGMGWAPGKEQSNYKQPALRPKGLGLGADKVIKEKKAKMETKEGEPELIVVKNGFVKITSGKHSGYYGKVVSLDEDTGRVLVELPMKKETVNLVEFMMQPVTKTEFDQQSRVLNADKYEEYKKTSEQSIQKKFSEQAHKSSSSNHKNENRDLSENDRTESRREKESYRNGKSVNRRSRSNSVDRTRRKERNRAHSSDDSQISSDGERRNHRKSSKVSRRRHSASSEERSKRNLKKHASTDSIENISDFDRKHRSHRNRKSSSNDSDDSYNNKSKKSKKHLRDIDKKRKGKKKKRDRDRSPNYKKHRK